MEATSPTSISSSEDFDQFLIAVRDNNTPQINDCLTALDSQVTSMVGHGVYEPENREDVCQEVRLALWRAAQSYDAAKGIPFENYARRSMKNAMIKESQRLRRQILCEPALLDAVAQGEAERLIETQRYDNPEVYLAVRIARAEVLSALRGLALGQRTVAYALIYKGLSLAQIARVRGSTPSGISRQWKRARAKLEVSLVHLEETMTSFETPYNSQIMNAAA